MKRVLPPGCKVKSAEMVKNFNKLNFCEMKNFKFILSFAVVMAVVITSCKKENPDPVSYEDEMSIHSKNVLSLIKNFDNKLESDLKTGELITLDSAVWYTEALQNYDHAHPDSASRDFVVFETQYTIAVSPGGMVLMDDAETLYGLMEIQLLADFAAITDPVRFLTITDVALDSIVGSTAHLSVSNGLGVGLFHTYEPFEEDDDWIWGTLGEGPGTPPRGKCDGSEVGVSDGGNELARRLNNPILGQIHPYRISYTDIVIKDVDGIGGDYEDRLFVDWTHDIDGCINNTDLSYYLGESDDIIYSYEGQGGERPSGKDFVRVEIEDTFYPSGSPFPYFHWYHISYGTPYVHYNE